MSKRSALVLATDENYMEYAKQMLYSAHRFGNWKGDYVLLVHNIPEEELKWFSSRGVHIINPEPVIHRDVNGWPPIVFHKLYLLHPMMKKWDKLVYMDTDILILRDINKIIKYNSFAARVENGRLNIRGQLHYDDELDESSLQLLRRLQKKCNLKKTAFNVGVMVFNTNHNSPELFERAKSILYTYEPLLRFPEQAVFNLLFYKKWKNISSFYNDYTFYFFTKDILKAPHLLLAKSHSKVLHFIGLNKPWHHDCYFHASWKERQNAADTFPNIAQIGEAPSSLTDIIRSVQRTLKLIPMYLGHLTWLTGQLLKKVWPGAYAFLKREKS